ncbi:hypothetical protein BJY01DRAFT_248171 [Aspergillus pseudoustus]|uniref:Gylcosyl hydrolase 115 C-terminal domain-containing protein n=1 Tax=Aspergillus pseudoustus TaxID=1810923 RepID=A0ABR4JWB1_9EURO
MKIHYCFNLLFAGLSTALLEESIVAFEPTPAAIELTDAAILRDISDPVGVEIATNDLASDLEEVTGIKRRVFAWDSGHILQGDNEPRNSNLVIVAATADSPFISQLEDAGKIIVDDIRGKWETFRTALVQNPLPGFEHGLIIVGSDKRGTMFGVYTVSEQSGKSPLHWWADVPTTRHGHIYALNKTTTHGPPSVKYRGIFINDEAPALTSWWAKKSNRSDYTFDSEFYTHVFDLLVQIKANFLWPAMWGSFIPRPGRIFFTDDSRSQQLADDYGIVVSTSHHEPMQRASNEWNIDPDRGEWDWVKNNEEVVAFMEEGVKRASGNETYFTLGMRGTNDGPIEADDPIAVLKDVFQTQRGILKEVYGNESAANQAWTVYKEVMTYYAAGLVPPDDVTLIFTDDNWGNVQRLPIADERNRSGGIGMYYHFDYVGRPKSWKSSNNNNLPKVYKELFHTYERGADRIWVFNVGDIKPVEVPLSFALDLAWNVSRFDFEKIPAYLEALATRDFGPEFAEQIASGLLEHSHLVGLRKFESIEPTTYSILNFREAETVLNQWKDLAESAQRIHDSLPPERRDALYHLLTHPSKSGYLYYQTLLGQGQNRQFAFERRNSANAVARDVLELFEHDYDLTQTYNEVANGKWEGIMSTPKFDMGVADWRPSSRDVLANLSYVQQRQDFDYGFGNLGIYVEQSLTAYRQARICASINPSLPTEEGLSPVLPVMDPYGPETRIVELFHRGDYRKALPWSIDNPYGWLHISKTAGSLTKHNPDERLEISIDWSALPINYTETISLRVYWEPAPYFDLLHIPISNLRVPRDFTGFPESAGLVSIEAPGYQRSSSGPVAFKQMPHLGTRSRSGSIALAPYTGAREDEDTAKEAWVEYDVYLFNTTTHLNATVYINGALDTDPNLPMQYSLLLDSQAGNFTRVLEEPDEAGDTPPGWAESVADNVWTRAVEFGAVEAGKHTLRWRVNSPEVYLEKIVLAREGLVQSYLGPLGRKVVNGSRAA